MMRWFSSIATIGIDMSDHVIRAVLVKKKGKKNIIQKFVAVPVEDGAIVDGEIHDEKKVQSAIHHALSQSFPARQATVVVGLPESHGFLKTILIEAGTFEKEVQKHLPFPVSEVILDTILHSTSEQEDKMMQLISFAAIKMPIAQSYAEVFGHTGLHIRALEIESQALARLYGSHLTANQVAILVDIGRNHTTFVVAQDGHIDLTHTSKQFSGKQLTEQIQAKAKISFDDAEEHKMNASSPTAKKLIDAATVELTKELERVVDFHRQYAPIQQAYQYSISLTGAGSQLPNLRSYIEKQLNIPVQQAELPKNVHVPPELHMQFLSYSTAIGLAIRDFQPL